VGDIVAGVARAIERCTSHHLYNLGHNDPVMLSDMIRLLGEVLGKEPQIDRQPEQPGDVRQTYADIDRAKAELGYDPSTPFREGLSRYVEWLDSAKASERVGW
jgi:UDP-glucuronate 4-epimerase